MKPTVYAKNVLKTLSNDKLTVGEDGVKVRAKGPKYGLRQIMRKTALVDVSHGIVGFKDETGEILMALQKYILGFQMTDQMKLHLEEELGDALYFLTVIHKKLKLKMPPAGRKHKLQKMTVTEALLNLDAMSTHILNLWKKAFYGKEVDYEKIGVYAQEAINVLYGIAGVVLEKTPSQIMESNIAKLSHRYPEGTFSQSSAEDRDLEGEQKKIEEVSKSTVAKKATAKKDKAPKADAQPVA